MVFSPRRLCIWNIVPPLGMMLILNSPLGIYKQSMSCDLATQELLYCCHFSSQRFLKPYRRNFFVVVEEEKWEIWKITLTSYFLPHWEHKHKRRSKVHHPWDLEAKYWFVIFWEQRLLFVFAFSAPTCDIALPTTLHVIETY